MSMHSLRPSATRRLLGLAWLLLAPLLLTLGVRSAGAVLPDAERVFAPVEPVTQFQRSLRLRLPESGGLIRVTQARQQFSVDGTGLTAAVLDSGINPIHVDFAGGKIVEQHNYTPNNGGAPANAQDGNGHGTNVSGIIAANGPSATGHTGIAPGARLVAMKVLDNAGSGNSGWLQSALQYLLANHSRLNITVANLSLGTEENLTSAPAADTIRSMIAQLRQEKVAVVIAAGNHYYTFNKPDPLLPAPLPANQGMAWPAIIPESVSVGAVYDESVNTLYTYGSGARAGAPIVVDQLCPFSQRLHSSVNSETATDIFAPGAGLTSTGIGGTTTSSTMHGTSQAAPVAAGVILLMQQYHLRQTGQLPTIDALERWLRLGAVPVSDTEAVVDNVPATGQSFLRVDALGALQAVAADLTGRYTLSGRVTHNGAGLAGVGVTAGGQTVQTNANGNYTITDLTPGGYTVTPVLAPYTFTPASQTVNVQSNLSNLNFTATVPTYTISGTIRVGGTPLAGVSVTGASQTVTTNSSGVYTLLNVPPGSYTVTPSRSNYTFEPTQRSVTVGSANVPGQDFAATVQTYTLAGTVRYRGEGVPGVTLTLTGGATTTTNVQGEYSFTGLLAGTYTLTPSKAKTSFAPGNRTVTVGPSATDQDFTGTPQLQISGTIRKDGTPLAGVLVTISGRATTTNAGGVYTLLNLEPGDYTVAPSLQSHLFTPPTQQVTLTNDDQTGVDFSAELQTYAIRGRVTLDGVGLPGVTVTRTGGTIASTTTTTDANGDYSFSGAPAAAYTLTPQLAGHLFAPAAQSVLLGAPGDAENVNFTATLAQYTLSGFVRFKGAAVAGVRVYAGEHSALTNAGGAYQISGLTIGTYAVTPQKLGCRFSPAAAEIMLDADRSGINFDSEAVLALSGKVTLVKKGLAGVTVTLTSPAGTRTTTTAADGTYGFNDLPAATYTVTPSRVAHLFTPAKRRVRITKKSVVNQNFAAAVVPELDNLVLKASTVKGGRATTATVTVDGKTPVALKVALVADPTGAVTVPKVAAIPKGRANARFTLKTKKVSAPTTVTITATLGSVTRTATLTVSP